MKTRRIYTAWDSKGDEERLFTGLNRLVKYGVKPDHIMVYMLIGYWPGETPRTANIDERDYGNLGRVRSRWLISGLPHLPNLL